MVKKQHRFFAESFESDLNTYVFICNECCNQIKSGKIELIASRGRTLLKGSYIYAGTGVRFFSGQFLPRH